MDKGLGVCACCAALRFPVGAGVVRERPEVLGTRRSVSWLPPAGWEGRLVHQERLPWHLKVFVCVWGGV